MKILAISGSVRADSTNTTLLKAIQRCAFDELSIDIYENIETLPIFNPDMEGTHTPERVLNFCAQIDKADGLLVSSPEYVRAIPGGLKNSIDWLVSREEIMTKPVALAHASYRGDDMLNSLRIVLDTVTARFARDIFLRIPLNSTTPATEDSILVVKQNKLQIVEFLRMFRNFINDV